MNNKRSLSMDHTTAGLPKKQLGYSIIELMIASVIGLIVMSGAVTVFTSNKASQELSSGMSRIQESGRAALEILANDIRLAGYQGCTDGTSAPVVIAKKAPAIDFPANAIWGAEVNNSWTPTALTHLQQIGTKATAGNDVIYLQHGSGRTTNLAVDMTGPNNSPLRLTTNPDQIDKGDLMMISDCRGADIFRASAVSNFAPDASGNVNVSVGFAASKNVQATMNRTYTAGALDTSPTRVMRFESNAYFVGDSGRKDSLGSTIYSLFALDTAAEKIKKPKELVEGVEKLQLLYGERLANGNTRYLTADDANLNMARVASVQIGLLISSIENIISSDDTKSYQVADEIIGPPGGPTALTHGGGRKLRAAFNTTVRLRNRINP